MEDHNAADDQERGDHVRCETSTEHQGQDQAEHKAWCPQGNRVALKGSAEPVAPQDHLRHALDNQHACPAEIPADHRERQKPHEPSNPKSAEAEQADAGDQRRRDDKGDDGVQYLVRCRSC